MQNKMIIGSGGGGNYKKFHYENLSSNPSETIDFTIKAVYTRMKYGSTYAYTAWDSEIDPTNGIQRWGNTTYTFTHGQMSASGDCSISGSTITFFLNGCAWADVYLIGE